MTAAADPRTSPPAGDRREERRHAVLDAAEHLFLEQGYDRVSLAAIVKRSGGSLATVYEMFGNKQGLLRAMVDRSIEQHFNDLWLTNDETPPAEQLRKMAVNMHEHMVVPRVIALKRIVIGESLRDPAFARSFYDMVHRKRLSPLATAFRSWNEQGRAFIDDPEAAAALFVATVMGDAQLESLLGIGCDCDTAEIVAGIEWRLAPFVSYFRIA